MTIARKNLFFCLLFCATFSLSIVFGTQQHNLPIALPQFQTEPSNTLAPKYENLHYQRFAANQRWGYFKSRILSLVTLLKIHQIRIQVLLDVQRNVFASIKSNSKATSGILQFIASFHFLFGDEPANNSL